MSRDRIFSQIRASLGVKPGDGRARAVAERLAAPPRNLVPKRAEKEHSELVRQFAGFLQGQTATVFHLDSPAQVPSAIAGYLRAAGLPARLRMGGDRFLHDLPWSSEPLLEITAGRADAEDEVGLSMALAGVSETGTLVLGSGADNPVTLAFLPETHVIVVAEDKIVGSYEEALDLVRERFGKGSMPRTLNLVSGPSRTADIGGKIVIGAHGPRRLCVAVVRRDRHDHRGHPR